MAREVTPQVCAAVKTRARFDVHRTTQSQSRFLRAVMKRAQAVLAREEWAWPRESQQRRGTDHSQQRPLLALQGSCASPSIPLYSEKADLKDNGRTPALNENPAPGHQARLALCRGENSPSRSKAMLEAASIGGSSTAASQKTSELTVLKR